jgi:hypothetical protein
MSSYVLIGLPRSGTTILNALLKEQFNVWNLGEDWKTNSSEIDISNLRSDLPALSREQKIRLNYLKDNVDKNWILKIWPEYCLLQKNILDEMKHTDVEIIMTQRKNIEEHFNSWINALYRKDQFEIKEYEFYNLNVNAHSLDDKYDIIDMSERNIITFFNYFCNSLVGWRLTYELFKDRIKLVSYEDEIKPLSLKSLGITNETIDQYHKKEVHLVQTPFNSNNFTQKQTYSQCIEILQNYRYLVEV